MAHTTDLLVYEVELTEPDDQIIVRTTTGNVYELHDDGTIILWTDHGANQSHTIKLTPQGLVNPLAGT